jgi:ribosome-binding factor A
MPSTRVARVARQVHLELSQIVESALKDPRVGMVTLTDVQMTPDLRVARVFFSRLGSDDDRMQARQGLEHAAGFLRRELGRKLRLRHVPELRFVIDQSFELDAKIGRLIGSGTTIDDE